MRALTPQDGGDAAGDDSAIAPRPQHSQRLLSAGVAGAPFAVRAYRTSDSAESVLGFYETSMQPLGWSCVAPDGLAPAMRTCSKDGTQVSIVTRAIENGQTMVSVSEIRS
jgi:hypothetical protein